MAGSIENILWTTTECMLPREKVNLCSLYYMPFNLSGICEVLQFISEYVVL
jgi:hypothetical protein